MQFTNTTSLSEIAGCHLRNNLICHYTELHCYYTTKMVARMYEPFSGGAKRWSGVKKSINLICAIK